MADSAPTTAPPPTKPPKSKPRPDASMPVRYNPETGKPIEPAN